MNNKLPILIATAIGLCILTTSISVNSANARNTFDGGYFGGYGGYGGYVGYGGYRGMGNGGAGPVIQEPVDTGNPLDKFYNCLSHTHENPPTVQKVVDCYHQTLGGT